jgi:YHS domain-containing protein
MNERKRLGQWILSLGISFFAIASATAQQPSRPQPKAGTHGGSMKLIDDLQVETIVADNGLQVYVYDASGAQADVARGRGMASVQAGQHAKRYRYDLLPDGNGGLRAIVDLSKLAGQQVMIDLQIVGVAANGRQKVSYSEVATIPLSQEQLAETAIALQKVCPVSNKPLGSMGDPVMVEANGRTLYLCCAGCVKAVKANPTKYAAGRIEITVTSATVADAAAIAQQKVCPVMDEPLGSMGQPVKVMVGDKAIYLCCKGCIKKVKAEPAKYVDAVYGDSLAVSGDASLPAGTERVREGVYKVSKVDEPFIAAQKNCPVMEDSLHAMGGPLRVEVEGRAIYICCAGCAKLIIANPKKYFDQLEAEGVVAPRIAEMQAATSNR